MQATQSRTASESVEQSIGFAAFRRVNDRTGFKPGRATAGGVAAGVAESAGLAHDAGNLLGALSLYSELLARPGVLYEEHREYAAELRLLSDRSWAMIGRLVDHARVKRETASAEGTVLPKVVERCRGVLGRVAGRVVEVSYGAGADAPVAVQTEALERILTNLVKNAAEATVGEGSVSVRVAGMTDLSEKGVRRRVVLTVSDTGCGMSSSAVRGLMQAGGMAQAGGRGLGFCVVRELVAMSGGCLNVESRIGMGTCVSVEWYALEVAETAKAACGVPGVNRRTVGRVIEPGRRGAIAC
ncbi:MAG: HAMP domain-containing sensor histidine kinase [Edaphobacter sp.]